MASRGFDFAGLARAMTEAARTAFTQLHEDHPKYRFYCMALYTDGELGYAIPTAMSEEGLAEVVASYRKKPRYATRPEQEVAASLRWSPDDSPHHEEGVEHFGGVNERMAELTRVLRGIDVTSDRPGFDAFVARARGILRGAARAR